MDVVRINGSTWLEQYLVEGYSSFIWTERFLGGGQFQLKSKKIDQLKKLLPVKSHVGLRDSTECMVVETHSVAPGDGGVPELTITGRTFEQVTAENRCTVIVKSGDGDSSNMYTFGDDEIYPSDAVKGLIMSHITVSAQSPSQKVDGVAVENLIRVQPGPQMDYSHEPGVLYDEIVRLLDMQNAGIRNQLDRNGGLKIYIYRGVNRTVHNGSDLIKQVLFLVSAGHVLNPSYIWTVRDYKNVAYVVGDAWQQRVYAPGVSTTVSGEDRRILFVDGSQIKSTSSDAKKHRQAQALGLAALAKHNHTTFFDGEASPDSPYVRGVDYNLGDWVTIMGQYGLSQTMVVSEYTRTYDEKLGEKGFPTLVTPSELEGDA